MDHSYCDFISNFSNIRNSLSSCLAPSPCKFKEELFVRIFTYIHSRALIHTYTHTHTHTRARAQYICTYINVCIILAIPVTLDYAAVGRTLGIFNLRYMKNSIMLDYSTFARMRKMALIIRRYLPNYFT
jgi:putative Mn2+ efflux pump MntP